MVAGSGSVDSLTDWIAPAYTFSLGSRLTYPAARSSSVAQRDHARPFDPGGMGLIMRTGKPYRRGRRGR